MYLNAIASSSKNNLGRRYSPSYTGIAVGPVIGYFYQYYLIRKNNSVGTFSINLCGALLFCNILRLGFWFFNHYDNALIAQSILMIIAQVSQGLCSCFCLKYVSGLWMRKVYLIGKRLNWEIRIEVFAVGFGDGGASIHIVCNFLSSHGRLHLLFCHHRCLCRVQQKRL